MDNPERFMSEPGSGEKQPKIDAFFDEVLGLLGYGENERRAFCEIRSREIVAEGEASSPFPRQTDDRITELLAKGRTVAIALEVRDEFNFIEVYLTHFVTPELRDSLLT